MKERYVLIHTHGIADVDYSTMTPSSLERVDGAAKAHGVDVVPAAFLAPELVGSFSEVLDAWSDQRESLSNIVGFSIEGPLLGTSGGVPPRGIWSPSPDQWEQIARLGPQGLAYIVMAPDGGDLDDRFGDVTYRDIIDLFYSNGVRIALGHFRHNDPELSAARTAAMIDYVQAQYGPDQGIVLTDHLFNDMPRRFRHAWRTREEQTRRAREIAEFLSTDWSTVDLREFLGDVPAVLIEAAIDGRCLPFLNFDGDHVDAQVCVATLNHVGTGNLIGITDDTPLDELAGEALSHQEGGGLWYRSDGIVAAGTGNLSTQLKNLRLAGRSDGEIDDLFGRNPRRALSPLSQFSAALV
ncbi:hypothetical protein ACPPVW_01565 [Leifsonia sp. McL0607]|uniref:hypothetical protein n=1 Tax=Leifsonia sp. McL0607 TaxID=3415672 RepID=UPI003CEB3BA3